MAVDIAYYDKDIFINDYTGQECVNLCLPEDTSLENINFCGISFKNVNFSKIKKINNFCFNGATFERCDLGHIMFTNSEFKGATFKECSFHNSMIYGSNFVGSTFKVCNFANTSLTASNFRATTFGINKFGGSAIKHSDFDSALFYNCIFDSDTIICYATHFNSTGFRVCRFINMTFENTSFCNLFI